MTVILLQKKRKKKPVDPDSGRDAANPDFDNISANKDSKYRIIKKMNDVTNFYFKQNTFFYSKRSYLFFS